MILLRSIDEKRGGATIGTWEKLQSEFKGQFYLEYVKDEAGAKLHWLSNKAQLGSMCGSLVSSCSKFSNWVRM
ncbi:hypothetical protein J1N35_042774 [Gossypium stocksii]|uniref:Retrotransposon gag domain-containing protein n=1 Tax=Gossypium stocksii TaxID=47602 RepID=A0A9D3U653_9ROSI|nr:hypothetical protein J1N35_042774 [Gossypium stocksii]